MQEEHVEVPWVQVVPKGLCVLLFCCKELWAPGCRFQLPGPHSHPDTTFLAQSVSALEPLGVSPGES